MTVLELAGERLRVFLRKGVSSNSPHEHCLTFLGLAGELAGIGGRRRVGGDVAERSEDWQMVPKSQGTARPPASAAGPRPNSTRTPPAGAQAQPLGAQAQPDLPGASAPAWWCRRRWGRVGRLESLWYMGRPATAGPPPARRRRPAAGETSRAAATSLESSSGTLFCRGGVSAAGRPPAFSTPGVAGPPERV